MIYLSPFKKIIHIFLKLAVTLRVFDVTGKQIIILTGKKKKTLLFEMK